MKIHCFLISTLHFFCQKVGYINFESRVQSTMIFKINYGRFQLIPQETKFNILDFIYYTIEKFFFFLKKENS